MASTKKRFIPFGRLDDLRARPDADRIGVSPGRSWDSDYSWTVYASRAAMLAFCKGEHHTLVKDPTPADRVTNRNYQRPV